MDQAFIISAFFTLFVIIDPIGLAPLFVALTKGMDAKQRQGVALRAIVTGMGVLTLFAIFGHAVLDFMGISLSAFQIAGGMLLFLTALDMLFERRTKRRKGQAHSDDDPSIFPLATPLIAGPGAIATMILLTGKADGDWLGIVMVLGVMISVLLLVFFAFYISGGLEKLLGETGINVVTRLLGMLLAALSVQFVLDGLSDFGFAG